jgi:hydroxymethylpyrimidine/phosphomethylpyrimidine kinase
MDPVQERNDVLTLLTRVVEKLGPSLDSRLIPPGGAQIGYAIRGARDKGGIAAVDGRIIVRDGKFCPGPCAFGCDEEIARALVTVMRFDPIRRSAAMIRFSDRTLRVLEDDLFLECASYDPKKAPGTLSTMDWGVASCCRREVPDVIFSCGTHDGDAIILILGEDPNDVANNIIICSNRI